jgi:hypothetical protein
MVKGLKQLVGTNVRLFRKAFGRDVLIFLGFLLISLFFWSLQAMQEMRTYELTLPVEYEPVPNHITLTNTLPTSFKVTLMDKGIVLHQYYLHRKELAIKLNPMNWYRKDGIGRVDRLVIESYVRRSLNSTTELISLYPDTVSFYFVEKASKNLKVVVNHDIHPSAQHLLTGIVVAVPSTITAYAPQELLNKLDSVETSLLQVDDIKDNKSYKVRLKPHEGVRFSTNEVTVRVNVEEFTEKLLTIPVKGIGFPANERLLAFPSSVRLSFLVGLSAYDHVKESDFEVGVSYDKVIGTTNKLLKLQLIRQPDFVKRVKIQPESIECLIEKR